MPNTGRRVRFTSPTGHVFELFADKMQVGNGCGLLNPGLPELPLTWV